MTRSFTNQEVQTSLFNQGQGALSADTRERLKAILGSRREELEVDSVFQTMIRRRAGRQVSCDNRPRATHSEFDSQSELVGTQEDSGSPDRIVQTEPFDFASLAEIRTRTYYNPQDACLERNDRRQEVLNVLQTALELCRNI